MMDYSDVVADPQGVAARLHAALAAFGVGSLRKPDAATVDAWIEPALHRQHAAPEQRDALSPAQRALAAAIADGSILERDLVSGNAEAASARACG